MWITVPLTWSVPAIPRFNGTPTTSIPTTAASTGMSGCTLPERFIRPCHSITVWKAPACMFMRGTSISPGKAPTSRWSRKCAMRRAVEGARFWSPEDPYLYDVYTILKVDGKTVDVNSVATGFRKTEFKGGAGTGGVYLNDKFVYLKGFAQRSSNE